MEHATIIRKSTPDPPNEGTMMMFLVYKDTKLVSGPLASREGAYFECLTRDADKVVVRDIAGNDVEEISNAECDRRLREIKFPR